MEDRFVVTRSKLAKLVKVARDKVLAQIYGSTDQFIIASIDERDAMQECETVLVPKWATHFSGHSPYGVLEEEIPK